MKKHGFPDDCDCASEELCIAIQLRETREERERQRPQELRDAIAWLQSEEVNAGPRTLKAISTMLAALSAQQAPAASQSPGVPAGWKPIETAPRDEFCGYLILATTTWVCEGYWNADDGCWWERNNDPTDSWGSPLYPTHYMHLPAAPGAERVDARDGERDTARLDWLDRETPDLLTVPTAEDDFDWIVVQHHMAEPRTRELGRGKNPRDAIDDAMKGGK